MNKNYVKFFLVLFLFIKCGTIEIPAPPDKDYICTYRINEICVMIRGSVKVDKEILSWSLSITEDYVNLFYPGLDLAAVSKQEELKLRYAYANMNTEHQAVYKDYDTTAIVNLRVGENITERMTCMDTYYVAMHEILHFIVSRYIKYDYEDDDPHMVPDIFNFWEMREAFREGRSYDYNNIAEGLIYQDISNECGYK